MKVLNPAEKMLRQVWSASTIREIGIRCIAPSYSFILIGSTFVSTCQASMVPAISHSVA